MNWFSKSIQFLVAQSIVVLSTMTGCAANNDSSHLKGITAPESPAVQSPACTMDWIGPSADGSHFVQMQSGRRFVVWGVNYDHDYEGRLLEDYWQQWDVVEEDFREIKSLGANVVRIHLQLGQFMRSPEEPNTLSLEYLQRLVRLTEDTGLYLDVTGLACYHKARTPAWYDTLNESQRWEVQARFWKAVARVCAASPAIFCYDLMNEPVLPGADKAETEWLLGEFGGSYFVQRISLDLAGRSREEVAKTWVDKLAAAIRTQDTRHMISVGDIPWAMVFPKAKPLFYAAQVGQNLDFVSVHVYPEKGQIDKAIEALKVYNVGKPLVVEEMFPLKCGIEEMDAFINASRDFTDGWISFYWGKTIEQYQKENDITAAILSQWLTYFNRKSSEIAATMP
ncbi:MAG: cellulase family glycosylhydrolase [Anaerohalosphaeraceae bacterium]